mmetsp:Transcript_28065/g.44514  ORF Transcript_28065/g.44514 Transcript_28065/m.44514 type:complete len:200 (+) Transcript_28065:44-643(+)|eukprot:CAMPEP_0197072942 /NCGR_PEP_ID=MMETSP1384-20130603/210351_1 /TAXON_ID=29189 /ORGANISM="Ammonia sp." /LENGTH=199 /DNA_ID=CAMNT_0042511765 /DNA_START=631 /DNA_END=1230 /DNA_ORIENTATION=+
MIDSASDKIAPSPMHRDITDEQGTLDEPVSATILRDLRRIGIRLRHVLIPNTATESELRNWDLWGPLIFCLMLAMSMSFGASNDEDASLVFTAVFVIVWCGAAVVTVNAALLGGKISFFQSVCVLGYCLFPLNIVSLLVALIGPNHKNIKLCVIVVGAVWSVKASVGFMAQFVPTDRKGLGLYPVFLFYVTLAWMILAR